jgi:hypothetical protein
MAEPSRWNWTPTSGLVAGRTFHSNKEYRRALKEARFRSETANQIANQLYHLVDVYAEADALRVKSEQAMAAFNFLVTATARKLASTR